MRPKLFESIPSQIRDWITQRARQGYSDASHVIVFYVIKQFAPGNADEQIAVNANILNPHCCSQPRAAPLELLKRKENVRRLAELDKSPPDLLLCYRGMESIFSAVFDKADQMLQSKWIALKIKLDLPH